MPFFIFGVLMPRSDINLKTTTSPKVKSNTVISITWQRTLPLTRENLIMHINVHRFHYFKDYSIPVSENSNICICEAIVKTSDGRVFSDIGDASPDNVPRGCMNRIIGVASPEQNPELCQMHLISPALWTIWTSRVLST